MSRSARLLDLLQTLRSHRKPVTGQALADETGISIRTLYRDIATLQAQGADIEGEPGLGYVLRPGFMLPPLMFTEEEIEALVLGSRWVANRADGTLSKAAKQAITKIAAVLPADLRESLDATSLLVGPGTGIAADRIDLSQVRHAIRKGYKIEITYEDANGEQTRRTIWPFALGFFETVRILIAWCEMRNDYRSFRTDRISDCSMLNQRYPARRAALLKEWKLKNTTAKN
jgi:predicted DNA-binding transcriptional regulator YafY